MHRTRASFCVQMPSPHTGFPAEEEPPEDRVDDPPPPDPLLLANSHLYPGSVLHAPEQPSLS